MNIPSRIKKEYKPIGPDLVLQRLHVVVGEHVNLKKGDTIILTSNSADKIEIRRAPTLVARNFHPYYLEK